VSHSLDTLGKSMFPGVFIFAKSVLNFTFLDVFRHKNVETDVETF